MADTNKEREAFEAWYCDQMRAAGYNADEGIAQLREGKHYGKERVMLNGKWEGWQARASLAASAGSEPVAGIYQLSPLASAHETITEVIKELRTYNPQADEHGGKFIHKGWANQLEAVAPSQVSESESESWLRNRALILRAIEERGLQLVNSGGLFWLAGSTPPSPPEGAGWRPIATAPEGQMVVVGWLDLEDTEHPERHDFDLLEDGCWQKWHDHAEHVEVIGGHGVSYTPPYTVWMPVGQIPAPPASEAKGA